MDEDISVREWQELYRAGAFDSPNYSAMEKAGWYHWECSDKSLLYRTKRLAKVAEGIANPYILDNFVVRCRTISSRFDKIYDEISFCPFDTEDLSKYIHVTRDDPYHRRKWSLFTSRYGSEGPEFDCSNVQGIIRYINRLGPQLEQNVMPLFLAEGRAVRRYVHRHFHEPWEIPVYRDGEHRYSFKSRQDGSEHAVIAAASLEGIPSGFDPKLVDQIKGIYVYCSEIPERAAPAFQKATDKYHKREEER